MIKHTQTMRWPMNCFSLFDHFMGLALKELVHVRKQVAKTYLKTHKNVSQ